jgi:hypothetical protein
VSWLHCHNEAYRRLGGIAATNRIDNVKTAVSAGAGAWGTIHPAYQAHARMVGFHVDACQPGEANAKGKTEAKVRFSRLLIDVVRERYVNLDDLQARTDAQVDRWSRKAICPATGTTVQEAWHEERQRLAPLPILPEPFDVAVQRPVYKDCMVHFEGRQYAVPFAYVGLTVEVRGCAGKVQGLPIGQTLENFDWSFQPGIDRKQVETLATCAHLRSQENVLLSGPPGVGKTHLARGLGIRAVQQGFSIGFYRIEDLMHAMKKDAEIPPRRLKGKKYLKVTLLVIDEVGFQPLNRQEASLFFRMVSYRYQRGSTVITTNKSVKEWPGPSAIQPREEIDHRQRTRRVRKTVRSLTAQGLASLDNGGDSLVGGAEPCQQPTKEQRSLPE